MSLALTYAGKKVSGFFPNSNGYSPIISFSKRFFITFANIDEANVFVNNMRREVEAIVRDMDNAKRLFKTKHILDQLDVTDEF